MSKEAMRLALEEMKIGNYNSAAERLEAALKQEQGEPDDLMIAYMSGLHDGKKAQQRKPLTDEQIYEVHENSSNLMEFTRAIEAAHGIK
jgi:hypothetical protein